MMVSQWCHNAVAKQIFWSVSTQEFDLMITVGSYIYLDGMNFNSP